MVAVIVKCVAVYISYRSVMNDVSIPTGNRRRVLKRKSLSGFHHTDRAINAERRSSSLRNVPNGLLE